MKVIQTLGTSKVNQEGVCRYSHLHDRAVIDRTINDYLQPGLQAIIEVPADDWARIVQAVFNYTGLLRITPASPRAGNSLHELIEGATTTAGIQGQDSVLACIVAILEHEGVIDLGYGPNHPIGLRATELPDPGQ